MKKILSILICVLFVSANMNAEDLTPSDTYYKENIAVNDINTDAPSLRLDGADPDPGGPGGDENSGDVPYVGAPVGDAILPIIIAALSYGIYLYVRKRKISKS